MPKEAISKMIFWRCENTEARNETKHGMERQTSVPAVICLSCTEVGCAINLPGFPFKTFGQQNYIYRMSQSDNETDMRISHLEDLFNRARPAARYVSEMHVEEETSSISKEIVNGDIDVRRKKGNLDLPQKNDYEEMLRRRFVDQFSREKEELQHRLGYVENSLVHLEKYQYLKRRLSTGKLAEQRKEQEWRKDHNGDMKRLELKKQDILEKSRQKEVEVEQLRGKIKEGEREKRKSEILDSIKKVKERTQKRNETAKEQKIKLKELMSRKELYQKLTDQFQEKQESVLEERKKKLAEMRQLRQPVNIQQILDHEQKVLDILKEKEMMRSREIRMNSSRARAYKPSYQSVFYKQLSGPHEEETEETPKHKLEKMRQFSEDVKTKFCPDIDERKRKEIEDRLEIEVKRPQLREQRQKQLLERPKLKGQEYLEMVKRMPKKKQDDSRDNGPKTDRVPYKNYLGSMSVDMGKALPWKTVLAKGESKIQTAQFLRFQSQKCEQKLKWKQLQSRVNKVKDNGSIDQQYYEMVKAKLSLLSKE